MKRRLLVLLACALAPHAPATSAQPAPSNAPLFDCTLDHHLRLLDPGHPSDPGFLMNTHSGFIFDAASGVFRWRGRATGALRAPEQWNVVQRGSSGNDWLAVRHEAGRPIILRVRTWGDHPVRFVLFDDLGSALTGRCR